MMEKTNIFGEKTKRIVGEPIGPYSQGVKVKFPGGNLVFIAGMVAWDSKGNIVAKNDLAGQYRKCMDNIKAVLEDAGGTMEDLVKIVNYVTKEITKEKNYSEITRVRKEFIKHNFPVSTLIIVDKLMDEDLLVEVDAIAAFE
jgi:2-iminobutanoate/2-iminopropanoate deaminase